MKQLTKRQKFALEVIEKAGKAGNQEILEQVSANFDKSSRVTVIRDLNTLVKFGFLKKTGKGRGVVYFTCVPFLKRDVDSDEYFKNEPDEREIKNDRLDFGKKFGWENLFSNKELLTIKDLTDEYRRHISFYSQPQVKKELERITVEFSWKSSRIEGNTYTLLDTERLIKEHEEAAGKTHHEAAMILNHKTALEYVWNHPRYFRIITLRKIEEIHSLISKDLKIAKGLRKRPVGIVGTAYKPHDNIYQIREAVEALCKLANKISDPFIKALIVISGLSYIQPFEDGNKRTSRLLGNAILLAWNYCPLSYRSIDEIDYKKAVILFYEQHSLSLFKKLFIEQYKFAVKNYFLI